MIDSENKKIEDKPFYVTTTDSFMSNWGSAKNKTNKLIFGCDSLAQARIVADNAQSRSDQKRVNICANKPYYNKDRYYVQYKDETIYPSWYKKDYFKK
jgi:hypothetical protein